MRSQQSYPNLKDSKIFMELVFGCRGKPDFGILTNNCAPYVQMSGDFDTLALWLFEQNLLGSDISVDIVEAPHRRPRDVTKVYAIAVQLKSNYLLNEPLPLVPSVVLCNKRGLQLFWILKNPTADFADFFRAQRYLNAFFNGVPVFPNSIGIPGFFDWGHDRVPSLIQLIDTNSRRYSIRELIGMYTPVEESGVTS